MKASAASGRGGASPCGCVVADGGGDRAGGLAEAPSLPPVPPGAPLHPAQAVRALYVRLLHRAFCAALLRPVHPGECSRCLICAPLSFAFPLSEAIQGSITTM